MPTIPQYEPNDTVQFTWTSSLAPDTTPSFGVYSPTSALLSSGYAVSSSSTQYYQMFTMPNSSGYYLGQWNALKTVVNSVFPFRLSFVFEIVPPKTP